MSRRSHGQALLPAIAAALLAATVLSAPVSARAGRARQATDPSPSRVDELFSRWGTATPGCAVGVARDGHVLIQKAYGMADLERDAPNTVGTIFEAGSIAKQVTATAVLLLARDGKLSLDDPARKYLPELPDYGKPLTIRHLLTHTGGLRDWGVLVAIGGWPRTTRVYTQANVVDISTRQQALNFAPGTNWSYSTTGPVLAAVIVSRVAGTPFPEFCRRRLFEPRGMAHTSWRDDHARIVKGRALAYTGGKGSYRTLMPFENDYGSGGLLTTVGDLLRWNEHLDSAKGDDAELVRQLQEPARLDGGQTLDYALGLYVQRYKGVAEVGHNGATAGYRAHLVRYPEQRLSIAVLCNATDADPERDARTLADLYLGTGRTRARRQAAPVAVLAPVLDARAGLYRQVATGRPLQIVRQDDTLRLEGGPLLAASSSTRFELPPEIGGAIEFEEDALMMRLPNGLVDRYERVQPVRPTAAQLAELAGTYSSEEVEAALDLSVEKGELVMMRWPSYAIVLRPLYLDAFSASGLGIVRFHRAAGRVVALSFVNDRVWDLRFTRR